MRRETSLALFATAALAAIMLAGCGGDNHNGHNRNGNSNRAASSADNRNGGGLSRVDFDKQVDYYKEEAKKLGNKIGGGAEDLWLWTQVRGKLVATEGVRTVGVDVDNNVVTLTGTVSNEAQKSEAEQIAKSVSGVSGVKNEITVSSGAPAGNANSR